MINIKNILKRFLAKPKTNLKYTPLKPATAGEMQQAKETLDKSAKLASFGELGGFRPKDKNDRLTSWWGGNFLGLENEPIPICEASGKTMSPVFQVRIDELPFVPNALKNVALLTLWFDMETEHIWETQSGVGFVIRTYESLDGLVPIGQGYREHPTFPTFPIKWHGFEKDLPDWESFTEEIPHAVCASDESEWFFDHIGVQERANLQNDKPIKIGGYSQWWQSPQRVKDGEFIFFLDSTGRGSFGFPAGGNANFFKVENESGETWEMRVDCT